MCETGSVNLWPHQRTQVASVKLRLAARRVAQRATLRLDGSAPFGRSFLTLTTSLRYPYTSYPSFHTTTIHSTPLSLPSTMPSSTTRNTCPAPAGTRPARPRGVKSQIKAQTVKKETMKMDAAPPIQQSEEMADEMEVAKESAVVAVVEETAAEAAKALLALSVLAPAAVADPVSAPTFTSKPAPAFEHTVVMVDVEVVARGLLGLQAARTKLNLEVGHSLSPPADAPAAVAVDRRPPSTATAADLEDKTIQSGLPTGWVRRVDAGRHRFYFIDT